MRWKVLAGSVVALSCLTGWPFAPSASAGPTDAAAGPDAAWLDLDAWMTELTSKDAASRQSAVSLMKTADAALLPRIAGRLAVFRQSANREGMATALARIRTGAGAEERRGAARSRDAGSQVDWFEELMRAPEPDHPEWCDAVGILGLSRMLVQIGTAAAARELAAIYPGFGELLRADVERLMLGLGERAVPALIEQKRGETKEVRAWALKLLEALGKSLPGEAVQTADNQLLGDVLRAYGRTKDADAVSVIIAFVNSERAEVREAAREAVTMLGATGLRQLRESYENLAGQRPPQDWAWEKVAKELFAAYDRWRLAEVYALLEQGLAAYQRRDLEATARAFDRALARAPDFERRHEMVAAYVDLALSLKRVDQPRAMAIFRKAIHIDPSGPRAREAESELVYLEALDLAKRGVVDEAFLRRAVDLNPNNVDAKEQLARLRAASEARGAAFLRTMLLGAIAVSALIGGFAALLWRGRRLPR